MGVCWDGARHTPRDLVALEGMRERVARDLRAEPLAVVVGLAEVDARVHARVDHLVDVYIIANMRAVSLVRRPRSIASSRATRVHGCGPSAQKRA